MAYDNAQSQVYSLGEHTTTNALNTTIKGPVGRTGIVRDVRFHCTTTHVIGGTTGTEYQIGDGTDDEAYATFAVPAATAPASVTAQANSGTLTGAIIPAGGSLTVKSVANAGTGAAGVGRAEVVVDWF